MAFAVTLIIMIKEKDMGTEEKRQMRKKITIASLVFLVLVVAYLIYTIVSGNTNGTVFNLSLIHISDRKSAAQALFALYFWG